MKCVVCKIRDAVVHYAEVVDGEIKKLDLCEKCAIDKGFGMEFSLGVGGLTESAPSSSPGSSSCPGCQMTFKEYRKTGRLGCPECYDTFIDSLMPMIEQMHKECNHQGKYPQLHKDKIVITRKIKELKSDLEEAILVENFEKAAQIRDKIKEISSSPHENTGSS